MALVAREMLDGRQITQRAASKLLGVDETTLSKALARPGMQEWCAQELGQLVTPAWLDSQIRAKVGHQAITGRIEQQRLWFELQGAIRQPMGAQAPPGAVLGAAQNLTPILIQVDGDIHVQQPHGQHVPTLSPHGGNSNGNGHG